MNRVCESCNIKMPAFRARYRHPDTGALVCGGCHPDKPGSEGRPVGHHGAKTSGISALTCQACSTPIGDAGLVMTAGRLTCGDGCKTAEITPPFGFDDLYNTWLVAVRHPDGTKTAVEINAPDARAAAIEAQASLTGTGAQVGNVMLLRGGLRSNDLTLAASKTALTNVPPHEFQGMAPAFQICDVCDMTKGHAVHSAERIAEHAAQTEKARGTLYGDLGLAASRRTASWSESVPGESWHFWSDVEGEATVQVREWDSNDRPIEFNWRAIPFDGPDVEGTATSEADAKRQATEALVGGQISLFGKRAGGGTGITSIRVVAHDSGDGQTIYHCPFCGAGQTVGRSDGTTECGFCKTYFTVQVQPQHAAMPQTDPATGEPLNMPGMPGDPAAHEAPLPTPTETAAPAGLGDFAPAGSGGAEGFAPAGQGPVDQFAPAGSGSGARAASLAPRVAWDNEEWDEADLWDREGEDPCTRCGGDGELEDVECSACEGTGYPPVHKGAAKTAADVPAGATTKKVGEEWVLYHPNGREIARAKDKKLLEDYRLQRDSRLAAGQAGTCNYCGKQVAAGGLRAHYEDCKQQPLKENRGDNRSRASDGKFASTSTTAMYLTPDQVALPEPSFLAHLAIRFAGDKEAVINQVRHERAAR